MTKFATLDPTLNLSEIVCHLGDCVVVADKNMNLLAMTQTFADLYGQTTQEMLGKNAHVIYPDFKNSVFFACIEHSFRTQKAHSLVGYSNKLCGHFLVKTVPYGSKYIVHIQPLNMMVPRNGYSNMYDNLTALPNRAAFDEDMGNFFSQSTSFGLIFLDVNRFRVFNETLGFEQGDRLLMELAARLKRNLFQKIYRVGPNQFAGAVLSHRADTLQVCTALLAQFDAPFRIQNKEYHVTASAGFKYIDDFGITLSEHVSNVDEALRESKRLKTKWVEYTQQGATPSDLVLVSEFKTAIAEKKLVPYYQPQMDTITGKVCGAEALVRWEQSEHDIRSPQSFLPTVYDYGFSIDLDYYMIGAVFDDIARWYRAGMAMLNVSINLSASSICQARTVDFIKQSMARTGVQSSWVTFEITENAVMENVQLSRGVIQQLSDLGFKIAIDDFGTGYSSMGYLLKYPTDILKIDKEFIHGVATSTAQQHVATSMIRLGKSLNMLVVAEGVETAEDGEFLKKNDCDIFQGYHFSKPLRREHFEAFIRRVGMSSLKSLLV